MIDVTLSDGVSPGEVANFYRLGKSYSLEACKVLSRSGFCMMADSDSSAAIGDENPKSPARHPLAKKPVRGFLLVSEIPLEAQQLSEADAALQSNLRQVRRQ